MMRAVAFEAYGSADKLQLKDIPKPTPQSNEVLIKLHASAVNAADWHVMHADPFPVRLAFGLFKPSLKALGADIAGVVEAVGEKVKQFKVGDEVYGDVSGHKWGGYAEYTVARETDIWYKPSNMTFEEAAAFPMASVTALQALREVGKVKQGTKVLVVGASGGVGSFAVQIAKAYGGTVTAVCSGKNEEMARSLGADKVIDYTKEDYINLDEKYDVIFDVAATKSLFSIKNVLVPKGVYINAGGDTLMHTLLWGPILSLFTGKKMGMFLVSPGQKELQEMTDLAQAGKVRPIIEKVYPLRGAPEAIKHVETKHAKGKNVINVLDLS